ncbi:hypothetical protein ABTD73_21020, partial [Acinetobacter baumannii]
FLIEKSNFFYISLLRMDFIRLFPESNCGCPACADLHHLGAAACGVYAARLQWRGFGARRRVLAGS